MTVYYDPYDVGIVADPYPVYARLRDEAPIYHNERYDFWALSRHADVERALAGMRHVGERAAQIARGQAQPLRLAATSALAAGLDQARD